MSHIEVQRSEDHDGIRSAGQEPCWVSSGPGVVFPLGRLSTCLNARLA